MISSQVPNYKIMEDLSQSRSGTIIICILSSYFLEYLHVHFNITLINIFIFLNMIGLYYIIEKIKIIIRVEYNNDN